jgi:two-component system, NtrC family, C4-dicarboxylate transport response regulator DctD
MLPVEDPRGLVLLVDDDARFLDLVAETLVEAGWAVSVHTDAAEALAAVEHSHPDVVVVDVVMPGTDGIELASRIRALHAQQHITLFSSLFDQRVADAATRLGLNYVEKADGADRLLDHLDELAGAH